MPVTKRNIAKNISRELNKPLDQSLIFLKNFIDLIKLHSQTGKVKINKFGTFEYKQTPQRIGRNPRTKKEHKINSFKRFVFKSSIKLKKIINWYNTFIWKWGYYDKN